MGSVFEIVSHSKTVDRLEIGNTEPVDNLNGYFSPGGRLIRSQGFLDGDGRVLRRRTFSRWPRLLLQQAITINARNIDVKPAKLILFMLDELASLGPLVVVERAYRLMAGYGMQMWGIVQDVSALRKL